MNTHVHLSHWNDLLWRLKLASVHCTVADSVHLARPIGSPGIMGLIGCAECTEISLSALYLVGRGTLNHGRRGTVVQCTAADFSRQN